ncbi:MAG: YDG domain-containing protein, partial [Verrucomicrobia bacterium]|nr:YDG domain-containing protein [Verrucomicrobiota bacterium]
LQAPCPVLTVVTCKVPLGTTTIGSGGVLAIGSGGVTFGRTLTNGGTGSWSGGNLSMSAGVSLNNLAGGSFDITADGRLSGSATTPINNAGLFRQTAGTAGTTIGVPFNNSGTAQVQTLTLTFNLGGTHTGIFNTAGGATVVLGGGSHVLGAGSVVTGAGVLAVTGGATTLTASGTFGGGSTLSVTAGTATLTAVCDVTGATLAINTGVLNYNSAGPVAAVNLNGGTLAGTSTINVTGQLTLAGGTVTSSLVNANGGLNINGGGFILNGGKLINRGTAVWSAGNFTGANGAVFTNALGATFINSFDGNAPSGAGATPLWVNNGIFQKTNGTAALGATSIDFQFLNTGTVEVQTNTLRYAVNTQTAGLTLLDGGSLTAQAQPLQLLGGSLVGTGLVTVANVQNVINSAAISPGLSPGELDIAGNYQQTASGVLNIELGGNSPGTGFDLVTVTAGGAGGVATLGGTLNVTLINGFSPPKGAAFTFMTAAGRVGAFATFLYPSNDIGMTLSYDATSAKVTVSNLKPVVANLINNPAPITYGSPFSFQFPANTFSDPDNDTLTYTALGMPAGIAFSSATRTFSGTPTQAGVFPVVVAATDNGIPSLSVTNTFTLTVTPANLTGSFTAGDKVYDGNTNATVLTRTLNGVLAGDAANVTLTGGTASFATATVGVGKTVTLSGATLTGSAAGNYNLSSVGTTTAAITALGITGSFTAAGKVYDGGTNATVLTRSLGGVLAGDTANVTLTGGTAGFANAAVGASKLVTLTGAALTGTAAGNYSLSSVGTATAAITALGITGSVTAADKVYDGNTNATVLTRSLRPQRRSLQPA